MNHDSVPDLDTPLLLSFVSSPTRLSIVPDRRHLPIRYVRASGSSTSSDHYYASYHQLSEPPQACLSTLGLQACCTTCARARGIEKTGSKARTLVAKRTKEKEEHGIFGVKPRLIPMLYTRTILRQVPSRYRAMNTIENACWQENLLTR